MMKYSDLQATTFLTWILNSYRPNSSTCFGNQKSLLEGSDLRFMIRSRWSKGGDDHDIKKHLSAESKDLLSQIFEMWLPLSQNDRELLSPDQNNFAAIRYWWRGLNARFEIWNSFSFTLLLVFCLLNFL